MPYSTVVAGTTITASWANANVRDQVVTPHASTSARTSAVTAPVQGMVTPITGDKAIDWYDGSAWQRVSWYGSAGRVGGQWRRASNQSLTDNATADISWDTEDADSNGFWSSGTDITIPSGLGGLYVVTWRIEAVTNGLTPTNWTGWFEVNDDNQFARSTWPNSVILPTGYGLGGCAVVPLSPADYVTTRTYWNDVGSASINVVAQINMYRLAL